MTDLARYAQVRHLIDKIDAVEAELTENERKLVGELRRDHADPAHDDAWAVTALETVLRNVGIRKGFAIDPKSHIPREIELPRKAD